jgi:predicted Rossmann fold nucleotide-binding protein DprA/Smf involved in DNA uptake
VQELGGDLQAVYAALPPAGQSADTAVLCEKTGFAPGRLMAALTRLEMRGLVRQRPGRRFEKAL